MQVRITYGYIENWRFW